MPTLGTQATNLANFMRTLALPEAVAQWSLTSLREKFVKIGAKVVQHARYAVFQMAEVAVPKDQGIKSMDRTSLGMLGTVETPGELRNPPMASWEARSMLAFSTFHEVIRGMSA